MSDLNRLEDETRTETTTPTPAETPTQTATAPDAGPEVLPTGTSSVSGVAPATEGVAPRKKRRRGTRGGQGRQEPAGGEAGGGAAGAARRPGARGAPRWRRPARPGDLGARRDGDRCNTSTRESSATSTSTAPHCSIRSTPKRSNAGGERAAKVVRPV